MQIPVCNYMALAPGKKNTMERYLDDQYAQWMGRPPTTFGVNSHDPPLHKPKVTSVNFKNTSLHIV